MFAYRPVHLSTQPIILGHGGMGVRSTYPLNSGISVKTALSERIDGVELDVRMSLDGVLFAIHDNVLTTSTDCINEVAATPSEQLTECNLKTWLRSAPIESLHRILQDYVKPESYVSLDVKISDSYRTEDIRMLTDKLNDLIKTNGRLNFIIESQNELFLASVADLHLDALVLLNSGNPDYAIDKALGLGIDGIIININDIDELQLHKAKQNNLTVAIWGVGSVFHNRKALLLEPDIIQTDDIGSMMTLLDRD